MKMLEPSGVTRPTMDDHGTGLGVSDLGPGGGFNERPIIALLIFQRWARVSRLTPTRQPDPDCRCRYLKAGPGT